MARDTMVCPILFDKFLHIGAFAFAEDYGGFLVDCEECYIQEGTDHHCVKLFKSVEDKLWTLKRSLKN